jgi:predicted ATPase
MLTRLRLERFKSFAEAELTLGPLTLLVGANASGKSNLRDAFRFFHGIGRGYTVAEIIGEKWGEGGVLQWRGIRGGTREVTFWGARDFSLEAEMTIALDGRERKVHYCITVEPGGDGTAPRIVSERLLFADTTDYIFDSEPEQQDDHLHLLARVRKRGRGRPPVMSFLSQQPVLSQCVEHRFVPASTREIARLVLNVLGDMRFLDLNPEAMRRPSLPGQTVLGDQGENLSSVLLDIVKDEQRKQALLHWVQELTPMDARDFRFDADASGRVLLILVEQNGRETTVNSASDGTLRFLAMIAALLGPDPARFYFFEELDNGIHPTRLHLLLQLIEQQVERGTTQVVATTHSPQLLRLLSPAMLEHAVLTYRLPGHPETRSKRIMDIPEARRAVADHDLAHLYESGWLEDVVAFEEAARAMA